MHFNICVHSYNQDQRNIKHVYITTKVKSESIPVHLVRGLSNVSCKQRIGGGVNHQKSNW